MRLGESVSLLLLISSSRYRLEDMRELVREPSKREMIRVLRVQQCVAGLQLGQRRLVSTRYADCIRDIERPHTKGARSFQRVDELDVQIAIRRRGLFLELQKPVLENHGGGSSVEGECQNAAVNEAASARTHHLPITSVFSLITYVSQAVNSKAARTQRMRV